MPERAIALEYHDVIPDGGVADDTGFPGNGPASYKIERARFAEHLTRLAEGPAAKAIDRVERIGEVDAGTRPVYLTFDDGGVSAHSDIAGMLEDHAWPGHFMVTSDRVGSPNFLSEEQVVELDARGHVICSHSASHPPRMGALDYGTIEAEWRKSVGVLSEILGKPVVVASVPGGLYAPRVGRAAAAAGIRFLFTSEPTTAVHRVGDCLVLGRYSIRAWTPAQTAARIAEGHLLPRLRQWSTGKSLRLARMLGGSAYLRFRNFYWARIARK